MDTRTIARLAEITGQHNLNELEIEEQGLHIHLHRNKTAAVEPPTPISDLTETPVSSENVRSATSEDDPQTVTITSPLVGTYYSSSSPEAEPFVHEGVHVKAGTTVCIIEAMKVMNEVKAEQNGVITKIMQPNKAAVEYGSPLFEMRVDD